MANNPKLKSVPPNADVEAVEAIVEIAKVVLRHQQVEKPTIADIARITGRASRLLRLDADEKATIENRALLALAKQNNLLGQI